MKVNEVLDTINIIDDIKTAICLSKGNPTGYLTIDEDVADKIAKIVGDYESYILGLEVRRY